MVAGAGHNGLTLALYMATAGLKVVVLEGRHEFGGGLSTEEVTLPGFLHNLHSNFHGMIPFLPPWRDFGLERRGVRYFHPEANIGMPLRDGRALVLHTDELETHASIARFSPRDADTFRDLRSLLVEHIHELLRVAYTPAPTAEARSSLEEEFARRFGRRALEQSAADYVRERFSNPHVQALLLYQMAICGFDPRQPGFALAGLGYLGFITNWQLCRGGSHHLAHALGGELLARGGDLVESARVERVLLEGGRAAGVVTSGGVAWRARLAVVSSVDVHQTLLEWLPREAIAPELRAKLERVSYGPHDVLFGVHVALREPPRHRAAAFDPAIDRTFNFDIGYETADDVLEHLGEVERGELPRTPRLNASCNTLFDPTQAPEGRHTLLIWQFAPFEIAGLSHDAWDRVKDGYARRCLESWREYAPNLDERNILAVHAYTPLDIVRKLPNMRRGGFHCGAVTVAQSAQGRPVPELAQHRTPVPGLYLCGSCTHVHGGILASPGYNCAQVLADDLGLRAKLPMLGRKPWDQRRHTGLLSRIFGR